MTRTRTSRLRTLALTGIATTGAATVALTLMPTAAQAAEPTHTATSAVTSETLTALKAHGHANNLDGWIKESLDIMKS
ncbi:transglycosylase SLT domain-containing protein, partial [Streptomyces sp. NPDC002520]